MAVTSARTHREHPRFVSALLFIDGGAGLVVGASVLLLSPWLSGFYGLPRPLILVMGVANVGYGAYALSLARRPQRPLALLTALIIANAFWAALCAATALVVARDATYFGLAHLVLEALVVGGLATLEWRYRDSLRVASPLAG